MKNRPTALGAYIFAGGFTLGVQKHFRVLAHLEDGPFGVETVQRNLKLPVHQEPATWPLGSFRGKVDFVYANPPCAPWSACSAGRQVPWRLDPRVDCVRKAFGLLESLRPKVWALESVRPFFTKGRELCDALVKKGNQLGYHATVLFVEASRHGVAQHRPRVFLVLSKLKIDWTGSTKSQVTVGEVLKQQFATKTAIRLGPQYNELVRRTKPGQRSARVFDELYPAKVRRAKQKGTKVIGRPSFQLQRLDPKGFCSVLTGDCRKIHPRENRMITVEEAAALSGFPTSYKFAGSVGLQTQQIAKGVMPPVGEYLASQVFQALVANKPVRKPEYEFAEVYPGYVYTKYLD